MQKAADPMNAEEKVLFARIMLSKKYPFFSYLLNFLKTKQSDTVGIGTMSTDGVTIFYGKAFVEALEPAELMFVLCHEILHVVFGHCQRIGVREAEPWFQATDYAVNAILMKQSSQWMKMPKGMLQGLYDKKYEDMTAEAIYDDVKKTYKPRQKVICFIEGPSCGHGDKKEGAGEDGKATLEELWRNRTYGAYVYAKRRGNLPAGLELLIKSITAPEVNWRVQLQNFINQFCRDDYTWERPNRLFLHRGIILPSAHSETIGTIVVVIDTSGSMSEEQLAQMMSEMQCIRNSYPMTLRVIICDAEVHNEYVIEPHGYFDISKIKLKGRGGTDFRPAFEYVTEKKIFPTAMVFMTDGYGSYPDVKPNYPVLWAMTKQHEDPPFGRAILLSV